MSADGHEEHVQAFLTSVLGQEADLADEAALRTLLSEADDRAAKMRLEVARIVQEDRADVDSTLAFAERLQSVLPAMLSREADPYATLQADLQGSLLRRQELEQELHALDAVTSALHALAEMHSAYVTFTGRMEACELAMAADSLLAMRGHVKALHAHLGGQEARLVRQVDAQVAACEAQLRAEVQAAWAELALGQSADAPAESAAPPSLHLHSSARGVGVARLLRALHKLGALESCIEQLGQRLLLLLEPLLRAIHSAAPPDAQAFACVRASSEGGGLLLVQEPPAAEGPTSATGATEPSAGRATRSLMAMCDAMEGCASQLQAFFATHCAAAVAAGATAGALAGSAGGEGDAGAHARAAAVPTAGPTAGGADAADVLTMLAMACPS